MFCRAVLTGYKIHLTSFCHSSLSLSPSICFINSCMVLGLHVVNSGIPSNQSLLLLISGPVYKWWQPAPKLLLPMQVCVAVLCTGSRALLLLKGPVMAEVMGLIPKDSSMVQQRHCRVSALCIDGAHLETRERLSGSRSCETQELCSCWAFQYAVYLRAIWYIFALHDRRGQAFRKPACAFVGSCVLQTENIEDRFFSHATTNERTVYFAWVQFRWGIIVTSLVCCVSLPYTVRTGLHCV